MNRWIFVALMMAGLQITACQQKPETPAQIDPTKVEYTGEALYRVRLTAKRAEELGIKTAPVREDKTFGKSGKVIPITAVVYDQQGNAWTFTSPDSLVFVRSRIRVDHVERNLVVLAEGPPVGAAVVTSGAAQLLNDEFSEKGTIESQTSVSSQGKKPTGIATMKEDGTIKVVYKTEGKTVFGASIVVEYKPTDEEYQKILDQVGGLKVGESKSVPPLPEK